MHVWYMEKLHGVCLLLLLLLLLFLLILVVALADFAVKTLHYN